MLMLPGFTAVVVILATDTKGVTRFFEPKEYNTSDVRHKELFLQDLYSITAGNDGKGTGGDVPEYGMSGIIRCIRKSIRYRDTRDISHIILITDAPAKDHYEMDFVKKLLKSTNPAGSDLVVHGFLPEDLLDPLPGSCLATRDALPRCYLKSGLPYKEIIEENKGILVDNIAVPTAFDAFITKYNMNYTKSVPSLTCSSRKKRLASSCQEIPVLTITKKVTVIVYPSSAVAIVVRDSNNTSKEELFRNKGESAILVWNNPEPNGTWSVCINDSTDVDIKIENNFQFTVDFLKSDEDEEQPLLSVLPPPGCSVNVAVFTPQIGNLSCTETHALEVISSSSNQEKLECCGSYLHGTIILPTDSFSFRFHGITSDGHSFESEQVMRHQATRWTLLLSTVHAPSQISRGSSADYVFNVKTASVWPNCSVSVRIDARTLLHGVELEVKPNVVTLDGASSVSFRIKVNATEEATAGQGFMEVAFSAERDGTPIHSSRISIGIEVCVIRNCTYTKMFVYFVFLYIVIL